MNRFLFHFVNAVVAMFSSQHRAETLDHLQALSEDTSQQCCLWSTAAAEVWCCQTSLVEWRLVRQHPWPVWRQWGKDHEQQSR